GCKRPGEVGDDQFRAVLLRDAIERDLRLALLRRAEPRTVRSRRAARSEIVGEELDLAPARLCAHAFTHSRLFAKATREAQPSLLVDDQDRTRRSLGSEPPVADVN